MYFAGSQKYLTHLRADMSTRWLLSEWLTAWLPGIEKLSHDIFSRRPHIFPSSSIHVFHFRGPLFILRHTSDILITKSTTNMLSKVNV